MEVSRAQVLWLLQLDLAERCGEPALFAKGAAVYLIARSWLQHFQECALQALESQDILDFSSCPLDNSSLLQASGELRTDVRDLSVMVTEGEFLQLFRSLATHPDQVIRLWVFWTPGFQMQFHQKLTISAVILEGARLNVTQTTLAGDLPLGELLALLLGSLEGKRVSYWSSLIADAAETAHEAVAGTSLHKFATRLEESSWNTPALQVLQSLVVVVRIKEHKSKSLLQKWIEPLTSLGSKKDVEQVAGLANLGNTCFLNCVLQALAHVPHLALYCHITNPTGRLASRFTQLVRDLFTQSHGVLQPNEVLSALGAKYCDGSQQDADEVLIDLLQGLSEGVQAAITIPPLLGEGEQAWLQHLASNYSISSTLFSGLQATSLICGECSKRHVSYSPFTSLPLQLTSRRLFFIRLVPCDPAKPQISFTLQVQSPLEHEVRLSTLKKALQVRLSLQHFYLSEENSEGKFDPLDLSATAEAPAYRALELPSQGVALLLEVKLKEQLLGVRVLVCSPTTKLEDLHDRVVDSLDVLGSAAFERLGFITQLQHKRMTEAERAAMECCVLQVVRGNKIFTMVQAQLFARTAEQLLALPEGVRLRCSFTALPDLLQEALQVFSEDKHLSERKEEQSVVATLPQLLEFTLSARSVAEKLMCSSCRKLTTHSSRQHIEHFPLVSVFHLMRVRVERRVLSKSSAEVCYPERGLDLRSLEQGPSLSAAIYDLSAVIRHFGSAAGGHYVAYVRSPLTTIWFRCDDSKSMRVKLSEVLEAADLLVYVRR